MRAGHRGAGPLYLLPLTSYVQVIAGHRKEGSLPPTEIAASQRAKIEKLTGEYVRHIGKL